VASNMDEHEILEIKREIVESRSLTIKTNNLVNALAADLKSIGKRQQGYERRLVFNSATAYVVTIVVLFVVMKLAWDARVESVRAETRHGREKLEQLEKELKTAKLAEEQRLTMGRKAAQFYDLIREGKREETIRMYPEVAKLDLSRTERAVFQAAAEKAKDELSIIAYQDGLDHARTGRWHEAYQSLSESLSHKSSAAHSPQAQFQLSRALCALNRQREAIPILLRLSEASADKEVMDDATLLLAQAQIDSKAYNDAKNTLRAFIRRFPSSPLINDARITLAEVQLHH